MKPLKQSKSLKKPFQRSSSEIFLNTLMTRKRGVKTPRTVVRKYGKVIKILVPLVLLAGGIFYLLKYIDENGFLDIKEIQIEGAVAFVNAKDLSSLVDINILGKRITSLDTARLESTLKNNFLGAKNISIQRKSLNKILIKVEERSPVAVLYSVKDNKKYLIDIDGYILGEVEDSYFGLPEVRYEEKVLIGTFINKEMVPLTIEILELSEKKELNISSISFYPKFTKLFAGSGTEILLANDKDRNKYLDIVSYLIKKSLLEGINVSKIDLRYDKVIVSYD